MSRTNSGEEPHASPSWSALSSAPTALSGSEPDAKTVSEAQLRKTRWALWTARGVVVICAGALCYAFAPFHSHGVIAAGVGGLTAGMILLAEVQLRRFALSQLLGGAFGAVLGMFAAVLVTLILSRTVEPEPTKSFLECAVLVAFVYLGSVLGSKRAGDIRLNAIGDRVPAGNFRSSAREMLKLLDTSVLIDGRLADICEAQFLDGILGVPRFVLHELQLVADSGDALKRQRGRRGLDVLERIRKMSGVEVRILEDDLQRVGEVDHKLVEMAQKMGAKIVTNDFNLNKVATLQGLSVLNVNQLANALKPVVLPGEPMRVLILREGKETNQGVGYLDDGTMVVVDGARRFIHKSVDITVTSVHQTTAGKMIFGRVDERAESPGVMARQAAAGAGVGRSEAGGRVPDPGSLERGSRAAYPDSDPD